MLAEVLDFCVMLVWSDFLFTLIVQKEKGKELCLIITRIIIQSL